VLNSLQALLVLEAAQVRRRVSAPLRLAACALYGLAGAPKEAATNLSALDIKFILHDTLTGHWLLPLLLGAAAEQPDLRRCAGRWLAG
jgi:N-terminal acetyltransferase B complex non-catalytic subunit